MTQTFPSPQLDRRPWWTLLNRYQWYVFALAAMGWLFDTMDQHLFTISRSVTMKDLLPHAAPAIQTQWGTYATSLLIIGWATGGLVFGTIGDKLGRAKTMALTIFLYAGMTGLSALAHNWWQFAIARFLTGLGIGGEFAAGAALVAEVMPEKARAKALGSLQALSAIGNITAAILFWTVSPRWGWRGLYVVGAIPALLAVVVRLGLKEPEKWVAARDAAAKAGADPKAQFGRMSELFTLPRWRRNTFSGLGLAIAGVIGLWGVGFYSPELLDKTFPNLAPSAITALKSQGFILQQCGAFLAMLVFPYLAVRLGRRPAFLIGFLLGWISILITYSSLHQPSQVYYLFPLLGFGTLAPFGLYAVYFPELFPTRLRTTGTGFCYNVARYVAAVGPPALGALSRALDGKFRTPGFRVAAMLVASCYLLGIIALIWAPETRGQPLPEDEPIGGARGFEVGAAAAAR